MKHFIKTPQEYRRRINPLRAYSRDAVQYLTKMTSCSSEEAEAFVRRRLSGLNIPRMRVLVRQKNGDRKMEEMKFTDFLGDVGRRKRILSPSMTVYENPDVEKSLLGEYLYDNLNRRKKAKHEMFVADMAGDKIRRAIKNSEQNTLKIKNNSMSGAHSSPHTILYNKSSHSTLTSTCRTATSFGNANNEKLLMGNRHYWSADIVRNNITSIISLSDLNAVQATMSKYGLVAPTVDQTMACIERSSRPYWRHDEQMAELRRYVEQLSDVERAAFMFVGDFYHVAQVNPAFVKKFLSLMAAKASTPMHGSNPTPEQVADRKSAVKAMDANMTAFISMICSANTDGRQLVDIPAESNDYGIIAQTARDTISVLDEYEDFIRTFWVTDNLPASTYWIPSIVRQTAITSDTDSTIFTVQWWPQWYRGQLDFSEESVAIAQVLVFFSAETIRHILALYSANLGASVTEIHRLSMKNEYYFPVFCLTSRAKHYFAYMAAQEGNVFKKMKMEIKGVALRSSNVPPEINNKAKALMRYIMDTTKACKQISLTQVLKAVAKIEMGIIDDIKKGGFDLLPSMTIKSKESYSDPARSNYMHYDLWERVFAEKYGPAPPPPYVSIKVNLTTDNRSRLKEWVNGMADKAMAARLEQWLEENGRKELAVLMLPQSNLAVHGLPAEVIPVANIRNLIANTMTPFYLILETINYFVKNKNNTRLVSDEKFLLAENNNIPDLELASD